MNTGEFLERCARLRSRGWQVRFVSNLIVLSHQKTMGHKCDPITAVCIEAGYTLDEVRVYSGDSADWVGASFLLGLDIQGMGPVLNPSYNGDDPLTKSFLRALFREDAVRVLERLVSLSG